MYKKLTYLVVLVSLGLADDELVAKLAGEHAGNRLTVCMDNGTQCEGVLWRTQWVITRVSCLADKPKYQIGVIRSVVPEQCTEYNTELVKRSRRIRRVQAVFSHPSYEQSRPGHNLALLRLEYPYPEVERLLNATVAETLLQQFEPWLENTIRNNEPDKPYVRRYPRRFGIGTFESPVKMFISMVVVPSALFIVFFIFITCYTKPKSRAPLKQYEKI